MLYAANKPVLRFEEQGARAANECESSSRPLSMEAPLVGGGAKPIRSSIRNWFTPGAAPSHSQAAFHGASNARSFLTVPSRNCTSLSRPSTMNRTRAGSSRLRAVMAERTADRSATRWQTARAVAACSRSGRRRRHVAGAPGQARQHPHGCDLRAPCGVLRMHRRSPCGTWRGRPSMRRCAAGRPAQQARRRWFQGRRRKKPGPVLRRKSKTLSVLDGRRAPGERLVRCSWCQRMWASAAWITTAISRRPPRNDEHASGQRAASRTVGSENACVERHCCRLQQPGK